MIDIISHDNVGVIVLNQAKKRNCLEQTFTQAIIDGIAHLEKNHRVIILRATKDSHVWCAGHDIKSFIPGEDPIADDNYYEQLLQCIQRSPRPIIAMIEGSVWGGGCEIAVTCDIAIASDNSTFAITPAKIGLPYNTNGLKRYMSVLPLNTIKELFFTAEAISAERAADINLINHCVPQQELEDVCYAMAEKIASNAPDAIQTVKQQLYLLSENNQLDGDTQTAITQQRAAVYSGPNFAEGLQAFFEKRPANFKTIKN